MYTKLKKTVKSFLPDNFIYKHEMKLRGIYYLFFRGKKYHCNICNHSLRKFIPVFDGDSLCPRCGSLSRNRRLYDVLQKDYLKNEITVLDFSPSRNLYHLLKRNENIKYISTDYAGEFLSDQHYDITGIDLPDQCIDLIICYHILEHIDDDGKAMSELHRILKINGSCILQTPFKEGDIYEDSSIQNPEERLKQFGQSDHVRIYSVTELKNRLSISGFQVEVREFTEPADNRSGFKEKEYVLVARKTSNN
jgi:ubiquinone/menaquinone biosynthesis C-methylase UbiE